MSVSGKPEKQSSIRIMDMQVDVNNINRSVQEVMRWQYWITNGVVIKAGNEGYDDSAVISALHSVIALCSFIEPHFEGEKKYVCDTISKLRNYVRTLSKTDKSESKKAEIIIYCGEVLRQVNRMIQETGEKIMKDTVGEL